MADGPRGNEEVGADLAAIEERLKSAQADLDRAVEARRQALDRINELHAERAASELHRPES